MEKIIDCLFPRRCPVCKDIVMPKGNGICAPCEKKWQQLCEPLCRKCGKQLPAWEMEYCYDCSHTPKSFEQGIALLDYSLPWVKSMLMEVKYQNHRQYLDYPCEKMAELYGLQVKKWGIEALIPVPLHPARRRVRGFNQAEEIAVRLGRSWQLLVDSGLLLRVRSTQPQKELNSRQRLKNLEKAFGVGQMASYERVLLIDDIYTTGSTAEACARVLLAAGISQVYVAALAIGGNACPSAPE